MKLSDKVTKPIMEARYLTAENADRYRAIIRIFYQKYEKLRYWLYMEEVFEEIKENAWFQEYTQQMCQQDLEGLVSWGNLTTIQDTRKAATLEEFRNKKFRYQLSEAAVEIERMVIRLENLEIEGSSLEPTLLERLRTSLLGMSEILNESPERVYGWWDEVNNNFVRLNQNYQDYMHELNSVKAEEMMHTKEFMVFKDRLIEYLRSFVKSLQMNASMIEHFFKNLDEKDVKTMMNMVLEYEMSLPRIDRQVTKEQIIDNIQGRFYSIKEWFAGDGVRESEVSEVFDTTNEIIRKITRYAARISENASGEGNRKDEYYKLAQLFQQCENINEAHLLSAYVFGIEKPLHLKGEFSRNTESYNSSVFEEEAIPFVVIPRTRTFREKSQRQTIQDKSKQKEALRQETLKQIEKEQKLLEQYIQEGCLDFAALPEIEPEVRDIFLRWLSKGLESKNRTAKTEDGKIYRIKRKGKGTCLLRCKDGNFEMPHFLIVFEEETA